jgi:phytoene dehydrogenase-like protein
VTRCGQEVVRIDGAARTVHTAAGLTVRARHAILAATSAPALYEQLLDPAEVPGRIRRDLAHFEWDPSTIKVDWALDGPVPWSAPVAAQAGTVHIADDLDHLTAWSAEIQRGRIPQRPFLVAGQYAAMDPTRMPPGKEIAYAYTHLPQGSWTPEVTADVVAGMEAEIERRAPGFGKLVRARHVLTPADLQARDANLVGGALNGGTAQLHQQLVFRPVPGNGRPQTPIAGVYLASAAAHPGGGVHGAGGANAARAALADARGPRRVVSAARSLTARRRAPSRGARTDA